MAAQWAQGKTIDQVKLLRLSPYSTVPPPPSLSQESFLVLKHLETLKLRRLSQSWLPVAQAILRCSSRLRPQVYSSKEHF